MGFFNKYPYTDFHELNLDWVLNMLKEMDKEWDEFQVLNTITIAGTWDISKNYPKYAIVEDSGTGYMAIKPVPAGIAINNLDYWLPVGTYSSAILDLDTRLTAAESNITSLNGTVSSHTSSINNLSNRTAVLEKTAYPTDGIILCIGDSYSSGWTSDGTYIGWPERLATALNKTFNTDVLRYHVGGCGFAAVGSGGKRFEDLITDANNDTSFNNADVSLIIFGGGYNDAYQGFSATDIANHMSTCATYAKAHFPHAKLLNVFMANASSPDPCTYGNLYDGAHRWMETGVFHGMQSLYCGSVLKGYANVAMASDGRHPNEMGQVLIAQAIADFITTGNVSGGINQLGSMSGSDKLYALADCNTLTLVQFENKDYTPETSSMALNGANRILTRNLKPLGITPNLGTYFAMQCTCQIKTTTGGINKYYLVPCYVRYTYDGSQMFYPILMQSDNSNYMSLSDIQYFTVLPHTFVFSRTML